MRHVAVVGSALLFAACAVAPDEFASQSTPIINGEKCTAADEPTAVAILVDHEISLGGTVLPVKTVVCTGTLIAPDTVLVAAHCLEPTALSFGIGDVTKESYYVTRTADLSALAESKTTEFPSDAFKASAWVKHPDFSLAAESTINGLSDFKDVGIIFLEAPMDGVPEPVIQKSEIDQVVAGADVRIVGWGQQTLTSGPFDQPPPGSVGVKMCADTTINTLSDREMQIGSGIESKRKCHGDSGGPTFMNVTTSTRSKRRVIGVTSHAFSEEDCKIGGVDTRIDFWWDWIDAEMRKACDEAKRSYCSQPGIPAPDEFLEPEPTPDAGTTVDAGTKPGRQFQDGSGGEITDSCYGGSCTSAVPSMFLVPFVVGLVRRRRTGRPTSA